MNLWPKDLFENLDKIEDPKKILERQGEILSDKTRNLVRGEIRPISKSSFRDVSDEFYYAFSIEAPALRYSYDLMTIQYDIALYPTEIEFEDNKKTANSEEEFIILIKDVLSSPKTIRIVRSLLAMLDFQPPDDEYEVAQEEDDIPF